MEGGVGGERPDKTYKELGGDMIDQVLLSMKGIIRFLSGKTKQQLSAVHV